jgi:hypothetical protein
MATKPPIIASQSPHAVSLDSTGKSAARSTGKAPDGMARDVGVSKTAVPAVKSPHAGPMVVRPSALLKGSAPPPAEPAATAKATLVESSALAPPIGEPSTQRMDFKARLERLKEVNKQLKVQIKPLDRPHTLPRDPSLNAQHRIKATLARRKTP